MMFCGMCGAVMRTVKTKVLKIETEFGVPTARQVQYFYSCGTCGYTCDEVRDEP